MKDGPAAGAASPAEERLAAVVAAVRILSPGAFTLDGRMTEAAPHPAGAGPQGLVAALGGELYHRCYNHPFPSPAPVPRKAVPSPDLVESLSAANAGRSRWDPSWQVREVAPGGRVLAAKGEAVRSLSPGEYLVTDEPGGPRPGSRLALFHHREARHLQPGFYYAFGETPAVAPQGEKMLRFYWNLGAEGAPPLVAAVSRELNRFQVPFRLKCFSDPTLYTRLDAAVLFMDQSSAPIIARLLPRLVATVAAYLKPGVPLFTRPLAPGLGFAEDPGADGLSFGIHRCRVLAAALWDAHVRGAADLQQRLEAVARSFERHGLDPRRPHLGPGSRYPYRFPELHA